MVVREPLEEHGEPFSFPNHLLSKKLLSFHDYPRDNAHCNDIDARIKKDIYGYTQRLPVYYNSRFNKNPAELDDFIHSEKFNILIEEFQTCIECINLWMLEKKIVLKLSQDARKYSGPYVLNDFLNRLQSNEFSQSKTYLYSEGKKNLEIIALLIKEESISLEFRKEVIVLLLDENNFNRCVGACLTNLSDAAEKLKNYDHFLPIGLIKLFSVTMAREVALSNTVHDCRSFSAVLCTYAGCLIANYEIHAANYLCERLKFDLKLHFLIMPNDPYVDSFMQALYLSAIKKPGREDRLYVQYFHEFERQFNATNLVRFISHQLYEACSIYLGDYHLLQTFIESQLIKLGNDPEFSWGDIFTEEGGLKNIDDFMITIAERLMDSKWLEFPSLKSNNLFFSWFRNLLGLSQLPLKPIHPSFRIYPNNIALSWVKQEDKRQAMLDVLATEEGVEWLNSNIFSDPKNLKDLLQNLKDLVLFFKHLPASYHLNTLAKLVSIDFDIPSILVDKLDGSINFIDFYNLFTCLSKEGRQFFISNYPELVYSILNDILQQMEDLNHNNVLFMINWFIRRIIQAGFKDFSGIQFKKRDLRYDVVERESYLDNIDFSGTILANVVFHEAISNCDFSHANLQGTKFSCTRISDSDFSHANLLDCKFDRAYLSMVDFISADLKNTNFFNTRLIRVSFRFANLENINFLRAEIMSASFYKAKLSALIFKNTELIDVLFEGACLNRVDFNRSEILGVNFSASDLNEVNFSRSELVCALLEKSIITDLTLSVSQLHRLYKQGVSDFSKVRLAGNWRKELILPLDRVTFFSRVINAPNRRHFFCCEKRNLCFDKERFIVNRTARKERELEILEWKLDALENIEKYPFKHLEQNALERKLLRKKCIETILLKSELLGIPFHNLKPRQKRFPAKEFLGNELSESYSNDHASPRIPMPSYSLHH